MAHPAIPPSSVPAGVAVPVSMPGRVASAPVLQGWPVLRLGFRPFYLGAAAWAMLAVPLWLALYLGALTWPTPVQPLLWHAHEMLFGFAVAVIVGFLLTAGKAWTGLATPRGPALGALLVLWLAARVAGLVAPGVVAAVLDLPLLPLMAAVLLDRLLRAGNRRNLPVVLILVLLALANAAYHAAVLGLVDLPPLQALHAGLALVVMMVCVIGGRVIPAFTVSAVPGMRLRAPHWLDPAALGTTAAGLAWWVLAPVGPIGAVLLGVAAVLQALRLWHWQPLRSRAKPILWVLHAAYAWVPIGLALLAAAQLGWLASSAGMHALAVGAVGGMILGMLTRTARGHTGRPLQASRLEVFAYGLVAVAAVLRVLLPLLAPQQLVMWLLAAGLAWCLAFGIYLLRFTPWLLSTRLDGKDG